MHAKVKVRLQALIVTSLCKLAKDSLSLLIFSFITKLYIDLLKILKHLVWIMYLYIPFTYLVVEK